MPELVSSRVGKTSLGEHLGFKGEALTDETAKRAAMETMVAFMMEIAKSEEGLYSSRYEWSRLYWRAEDCVMRSKNRKYCVHYIPSLSCCRRFSGNCSEFCCGGYASACAYAGDETLLYPSVSAQAAMIQNKHRLAAHCGGY